MSRSDPGSEPKSEHESESAEGNTPHHRSPLKPFDDSVIAEGAMAPARGGDHSLGKTRDRSHALTRQLDELRALQTALAAERDRELADQRRQDAEAQRLMTSDPTAHVTMMRPMQRRSALVRELPPALLLYESRLLRQIERETTVPEPRVDELPHGFLMARHIVMERWVQVVVALLGAWLVFTPLAEGRARTVVGISDLASGILILLFATLASKGRVYAPWAAALVGLWVSFAPLAFWAPAAGIYTNDSIIGALVVAFSVIVPMRAEMPGPDVPAGWTYNPSTWAQRAPVIALAAAGFLLSRYMAAFQLGHIASAWDPLFGRGTERVLTSDISRSFPVSDAGLGAYVYLLELLSALMGDRRRWRTMPWMVAVFGLAVVPLGITSVVLVMLQPVAVGAWCTICLVTAVFMLIMVAVSLDEIVAMVQFLAAGKRAGGSAWRLFWIGGVLPPTVASVGLVRRRASPWREMFFGASVSWPLLATAIIGAWVLAAPWVLDTGHGRSALVFNTILGAVAVVVAFVVWAEVTRAVRLLNVLAGLAIAVGVWLLPGLSLMTCLNDTVVGILLTLLSVPRGPVRDHYGAWSAFVV